MPDSILAIEGLLCVVVVMIVVVVMVVVVVVIVMVQVFSDWHGYCKREKPAR